MKKVLLPFVNFTLTLVRYGTSHLRSWYAVEKWSHPCDHPISMNLLTPRWVPIIYIIFYTDS